MVAKVGHLQEKPEAGYSTILAATSTKAALRLGSEMKMSRNECQHERSETSIFTKQVSPMLDSPRGAECTNLLTRSQSGEVGHFSAH